MDEVRPLIETGIRSPQLRAKFSENGRVQRKAEVHVVTTKA